METVSWSGAFSVNVKEIDEQHRRFLRFLREAYAKIGMQLKPGELNPLLDRLMEHANEHFATEEKYFAEFKYEYGAHHIELHEKIRTEIVEFKERHKNDLSANLTWELVDFLENWLLDHVMKHDKLYIETFNANGLY